MTLPVPVLTVPQVATVLQVHRNTVHRLIRRKQLRARKVGRLTRVRQSDLDSYLDSARR